MGRRVDEERGLTRKDFTQFGGKHSTSSTVVYSPPSLGWEAGARAQEHSSSRQREQQQQQQLLLPSGVGVADGKSLQGVPRGGTQRRRPPNVSATYCLGYLSAEREGGER